MIFFFYFFLCEYITVIKVEFSSSLLQSSVSHDPSQITLIWWFDAQKNINIIINVENVFLGDSLMNRKFKRTAFISNIGESGAQRILVLAQLIKK